MNLFLEIIPPAKDSSSVIGHLPFLPQKPEIQQEKPRFPEEGRRQGRLRSNTTKYSYNWNKIEERKYINFLIKRRDLFDLSNEEKKCVKINVKMGEAVKSRTAAQCHCHHQKMMIKYGSVDAIIWGNLQLINMKHVPKKFAALNKELQQFKREKERARLEAVEECQEVARETSQPFWVDYYIHSDHFFSCQSFPDDSSQLL